MRSTVTNRDDSRMIHVRLTSETHKRLRIRAAELDTTIQKMVESVLEEALKAPMKKGRS